MIAFGPVPSRRFGMSLGINNISHVKDCTYSCIYCQLGRTKERNTTKKTYFHPETIVEEVNNHLRKLDDNHLPDCITIVPDGEPTLDLHLAEEIRLLKKFEYPVGVVTNASLLFDKKVREALHLTNQVCIKVDSLCESTWKHINRPAPEINFRQYLNGLTTFAAKYRGKLFTETMLIDSFNDKEAEIEKIASFLVQLQPLKAFLLTPVRPPSERMVRIPTDEKLQRAQHIFRLHGLNTELLKETNENTVGTTGNAYEDILNISAVHPIREDMMKKILEKNNSEKYVLNSLIDEKLIKVVNYRGSKYYLRYHQF
ncbi:MAG TPA: radical SAM protein [Cytophagales bacterium]|jgi:wyosine [tRNA(Phe)-imidazoG37] synthetase (radical SAM superfamily)|nr:radical SAM protein [Cytophagales bacterium]